MNNFLNKKLSNNKLNVVKSKNKLTISLWVPNPKMPNT